MTCILALGGSNSSKSINRQLANYTANQVTNAEIITFDLSQVDVPLFGVDLQSQIGLPKEVETFHSLLLKCDGIVLSVAEHNGNVSAAFKNLWDWTSRIEKKVWQSKPIFLMSTSPGARGALSAFNITKQVIPFYGGHIVSEFSLPNFYENFTNKGIVNEVLKFKFDEQLALFVEALNK
jgi:NAD(P)H-dependent FMN reductase